jgi:hypothetical protein
VKAVEPEPLYRGQSSLYGEKYKEGTTITWKDYKSSSTNKQSAEKFAGKAGVLFTLKDLRPNLGAKKRLLLSLFVLKMIILPRQARDKHRGNSKKKAFCAGACFSTQPPLSAWPNEEEILLPAVSHHATVTSTACQRGL